MKNTLLFIGFITIIGVASGCIQRKDYNCTCSVDLPEDTTGISPDYDTTYVLEDKFKKQAEEECEFLELGESVILPLGVASTDVSVACSLD